MTSRSARGLCDVDRDAIEGQHPLDGCGEVLVDLFDLLGGGDDAADFGHDRFFGRQPLGFLLAAVEGGLRLDAVDGRAQNVGDRAQEVRVLVVEGAVACAEGVQDAVRAPAAGYDHVDAADDALRAHEGVGGEAGFAREVRHDDRLAAQQGVPGQRGGARLEPGPDHGLAVRQGGADDQPVLGQKLEHLAVLHLQDAARRAHGLPEERVGRASGQGPLPQLRHHLLLACPVLLCLRELIHAPPLPIGREE